MFLLGTGKQRAGKTSRVGVNGQFLTFASWESNMTGQDLPTPNFESYNVAAAQTYDEGIMGILKADLRFGGDWDAGTNPLGTPPGLYPRDDLPNLSFVVDRLDTTAWSFTWARLRGAVNSGEVGGKVAFNCSGVNQGPFTFPTLSV